MKFRSKSAARIQRSIEYFPTWRQGSLSSALTEQEIAARLGFLSEGGDGCKVTTTWHFIVNGQQCAIWDYRGVRWSYFGPREVFEFLFPNHVGDNQ